MRSRRVRVAVAAAGVVAVVFVASVLGGPASAAHAFSDVPDDHAFHNEISWMAEAEISEGFDDGTFRPAAKVTRQAMAAFMYRLWVHLGGPVGPAPAPSFSDVDSSHEFYDEISWMAEAEISEGFDDGTFRPSAPVTRQAMAAFMFRLWSLPRSGLAGTYPDPDVSDVTSSHEFYEEIAWMVAVGVSTGFDDGTFRPSVPVTRQAMAAFMFRLDDRMAPQAYEVNTAADGNDAVVGDGVCEVTPDGGDCSLRAAITEANTTMATDTVTIAANVDPVLSIEGINDDTNTTGDLDISHDLVLEGGGAFIDADGVDRVLHVPDNPTGLTLEIVDVTLTGGVVDVADTAGPMPGGAAINGTDVAIEIRDSVLEGNVSNAVEDLDYGRGGAAVSVVGPGAGVILIDSVVTGNDGGSAIAASGSADTDLTRSRVLDNTGGGGVSNENGTARVHESEIRGHTGAALSGLDTPFNVTASALVENGSGINGNVMTVADSTISSAGPAVGGFEAGGTFVRSTLVTTGTGPTLTGDESVGYKVTASIIDGPAGGPRCVFPEEVNITSGGWNVVSDDSCLLDQATDLPSTEPALGPLTDAEAASSYEPAATSPAVDIVPIGTTDMCDASTPTDQRGEPRPSGEACDAGSVELPGPDLLEVKTAEDGDDAAAGDGVCEVNAGMGDCSLRAAISEANARLGPDVIVIDWGIDPVLSLAGADEDGNATGDLDVIDDLSIHGGGSTIDADDIDRVFQTHNYQESLISVSMRDLTITNGRLYGGPGAAIYAESHLDLDGVDLVGNDSSSPVANSEVASAIAMDTYGDLGQLHIRQSTIRNNTAPAFGRAMLIQGADVQMEDTEITDNLTSSSTGSAIGVREGSMVLERVLISGHSGAALSLSDVAPGDIIDSALVGNGRGVSIDYSYLDAVNTTISNEGPAVSSLVGSPRVVASTLVTTGDEPTVRIDESGTFRPVGSIIAGPDTSPRCVLVEGAAIESEGWNIGTDVSCGLDEPSDLSDTDPVLGALGDHGGPTLAYLPGPTSPAVDAIPLDTPGLCDGSTPTDQRGLSRPSGPGCDIGAVERQPSDPAAVVPGFVPSRGPEGRVRVAGPGAGTIHPPVARRP